MLQQPHQPYLPQRPLGESGVLEYSADSLDGDRLAGELVAPGAHDPVRAPPDHVQDAEARLHVELVTHYFEGSEFSFGIETDGQDRGCIQRDENKKGGVSVRKE